MLIKVKAELLGRPQLHQVVVEGLLGDLDLDGCLFKAMPLQDSFFIRVASVEESPQTNFLDHLFNGAFLDSGLLFVATFFGKLTILLLFLLGNKQKPSSLLEELKIEMKHTSFIPITWKIDKVKCKYCQK